MNFMRRTGKRALSVILSCIIAFGCVTLLSGTLLTAHATSGGSYYVRVYWNVSDSSDKNDNNWSLTYKDQNGDDHTYNYTSNAASSKGDKDSGILTLSGVPTARPGRCASSGSTTI